MRRLARLLVPVNYTRGPAFFHDPAESIPALPDLNVALHTADPGEDGTQATSEIVYEALPVDDPQVRQPDITRAKQLLGWEPEVALSEGLHAELAMHGIRVTTVVPGLMRTGSPVNAWFAKAFIHRLGWYLIELNSGRLKIGVQRYRELSSATVRDGKAGVAASEAPLSLAVQNAWPRAGTWLSVIALFATANTVLITLIATARLSFSMGRDGELPAIFENMTWSHDRVFAQSLAKLRDLSVATRQLPGWFDIDTPDDVKRLLVQRAEYEHGMKNTFKLLDRLDLSHRTSSETLVNPAKS